MTKTELPKNFVKHASKNPIQKLLIKNFYASLTSMIKDLSSNTILDAGCGEGFTMNNRKSYGGFKRNAESNQKIFGDKRTK